jgi:hypothetical protein
VNYDPSAVFLGKTSGVTVTTTDGLANDGFAGDHDNVNEDVENLTGTSFDDSLSVVAGSLQGSAGNDTLRIVNGGGQEYGAAGNDDLRAGPASTLLSGGSATIPCSVRTKWRTTTTAARARESSSRWTRTTTGPTARRCI